MWPYNKIFNWIILLILFSKTETWKKGIDIELEKVEDIADIMSYGENSHPIWKITRPADNSGKEFRWNKKYFTDTLTYTLKLH